MGLIRVGDVVKAYPINMGEPDQTNFDPRVEGTAVGMDDVGERLVLLVQSPSGLVRCEAQTAEVIRAPSALVPDSRPDLVAVVMGSGRVEVRLRGKNEVVVETLSTHSLGRNLVHLYPNGFHLDIRYDPHM